MKITLIVFNLSLFVITAAAQVHGLPGYIVRSSGDTLHGYFKEWGRDELLHHVAFKSTDSGEEYTLYTPAEIKAFQYGEGNLYRAVSFLDSRLEQPVVQTNFAKLLVTGGFDLYSFSDNDVIYFLVRKDTTFHLLFDDDIHAEPYVKGNYLNELNFFATFCEAGKKGIDIMTYSEESLTLFFQKLDACLNPNQTVTSYYHKPKAHVGAYAYVGGIAFSQRSQFTAEVRLRLVYPQVNPSVSLNVGLRYAHVVQKLKDQSYFVATIYHIQTTEIKSLPLTVQYNITRGVVQPFVFAGASLATVNIITDAQINFNSNAFYHKVSVTELGGAGVEVYITHLLQARVEERYEFIWQWPTIGLSLTF